MASATFRMPVQLLAAVEQIVNAFDVDKSDVFRAALRRFVAAFPAGQKEGAAFLLEPVQPRGGFPFTFVPAADAAADSDPEMTPRAFEAGRSADIPDDSGINAKRAQAKREAEERERQKLIADSEREGPHRPPGGVKLSGGKRRKERP